MKRALIILPVFGLLTISAADAICLSGPYAAVRGLVNFERDANFEYGILYGHGGAETTKLDSAKFDSTGFGFSGALGWAFHINPKYFIHSAIRPELEYTYRIQSDVAGDDFFIYDIEYGIQTLMANVYYDIVTGTIFTPYLNFGLGAAFINSRAKIDIGSEPLDFKLRDTGLAYSVGAGFSVMFSHTWHMDLGYRYIDFGDFEKQVLKGDDGVHPMFSSGEFSTHEVYAGIRYKF